MLNTYSELRFWVRMLVSCLIPIGLPILIVSFWEVLALIGDTYKFCWVYFRGLSRYVQCIYGAEWHGISTFLYLSAPFYLQLWILRYGRGILLYRFYAIRGRHKGSCRQVSDKLDYICAPSLGDYCLSCLGTRVSVVFRTIQISL